MERIAGIHQQRAEEYRLQQQDNLALEAYLNAGPGAAAALGALLDEKVQTEAAARRYSKAASQISTQNNDQILAH